MKILLVQPRTNPKALTNEAFFIAEPLGLEYVGANLVKDHDVKLLDMRLANGLTSVVEAFQPDLVGFTSMTLHLNTVKKLALQVKGLSSDITTMVGGSHAQLAGLDFQDENIDIVVTDDGMESVRQIAARLENGKSLTGIAGTCVFQNGEAVVTPSVGRLLPLDEYPFPERSLTKMYRPNYLWAWMQPLAMIRTSRGCPFRCKFCAQWQLAKGKYLVRDPHEIVRELAQIEEKFIFFADGESMIDVSRMSDLADLISEHGIKKQFFSYARSDTIAKHPELFEKWKRIGFGKVFIGLESLFQDDLDYVNKSLSVKENERALAVLKDLDIEVHPQFIVFPQYTRQHFRDLASRVQSLGLPFAGFTVLTPVPGTGFYNEVKDQLITNDYDLFDFHHAVLPTHLPLKEFYREMERLKKTSNPIAYLMFLRKFSFRQAASYMVKGLSQRKRNKNAYRHYQ
jgi:radical SAM superfamily enzyme YgiQ (UPF0313 family)